LLNTLLTLYDLTGQMALDAAGPDAANYLMLRQQILEALAVNGIQLIPTDGHFDPAIHKVVERLTCQIPEEDGEIVAVFRSGFRTERAVLRYAEVIVKHYEAVQK
jgi:molecular chaperone GrpE (heat shock protein)